MQTSIALMKWSVGGSWWQVNIHNAADNNQLFLEWIPPGLFSSQWVNLKPSPRVPHRCAGNICLCTRLIRICED